MYALSNHTKTKRNKYKYKMNQFVVLGFKVQRDSIRSRLGLQYMFKCLLGLGI